MQHIELPKFPVLCGEEAVIALKRYIEEIEEQRCEELSDRQTKALISFAQGLISSIEENPSLTNKGNEEIHFAGRIKNAIMRYVPNRAS